MIEFEIDIRTPADLLLYEGLPLLAPALKEFRDGALLIGGLANAALLSAHPVGLPIRATRDIDLGIDRSKLRLSRNRQVVGPALRKLEFEPGFGDEPFRFARKTSQGLLVVDCLVAKDASRERPPQIELSLPSLAAPGLAYAFKRGAQPLVIRLIGDETREIALYTVALDAAFVMKAALVASGERPAASRRESDTADAIMLAAACADSADSTAALQANSRNSEVKTALRWLAASFNSPRSAASRRVAKYFDGDDDQAEWAAAAAARFIEKLGKGHRESS